MKKKILLKTLIPLTMMGVGLDVTLPLVSCSCGNNDNNGNIHVLKNKDEYIDFMVSTWNASLDPTDSDHNWSSEPSNYQPMLNWFYLNIDASDLLLLFVDEYVEKGDIIYPISFEYNSDLQVSVASYEQTNPSAFIEHSIVKDESGFHYILLFNGSVFGNATIAKIDKVGISSGTRDIRINVLMASFSLRDNIWPRIIFPQTF